MRLLIAIKPRQRISGATKIIYAKRELSHWLQTYKIFQYDFNLFPLCGRDKGAFTFTEYISTIVTNT